MKVFAATAITAAPTFSKAAGFLRGAGDIRRLSIYSQRSGESVNTIYWIDGEYVTDALAEINYLLRDWRQHETKTIDTRTIDIVTAAHNLMDTTEPYLLLSGYRSAKTNAMLRRQSHNVAKHSLHIQGQAMDLRLGSRSVKQMASAAKSCRAGGVGSYYRSNFVHMDCGDVRTWNA